ncbi:MAG: helix-turn-helix domain-containing protein [Actinomycetota bacterium]|nr:helix-turn-helix domain-containing protein [Actinomycetota bacterium]
MPATTTPGEDRTTTRRASRAEKAPARPRGRSASSSTTVRGSAGFTDAVGDALRSVPEPARDGFLRGVTGDDQLDSSLWGRGPSPTQRKQAALENLRRQFTARSAVLEHSLTRAEAADLLEVSEQAVLDRIKAGDLLGLKKGREWRLPLWQFNAGCAHGFVPGLARLRDSFPGGVVSLTEWAATPNVDLDGATPTQALAANRIDDVIAVAATSTSAAW